MPAGEPRLLDRSAGGDVFGSDAAGYHAARLGYPDALYDRVLGYAGDIAPRTVEIGPGTGLATRALLDRGVADLIAVEPDPALAAYLRTTIADRRLHVVEARFVEADLAPAACDLAVAACAFHWIEPAPGFAKLRAIVRRGGAIALWWHSYRNPRRDPFFDALAETLHGLSMPPSEGAGGHLYLDRERQSAALAAAGFGAIETETFTTERMLDAAAMRALYASFSFVRLLPDLERHRLLDRIGELVERRFGGAAPNVVLTPLYLARRS